MTNTKIDEAVTAALEVIGDAHPNLLTMTELAQAVASGIGVSVSTARKRLRTAVEEDRVLELAPYSRKFFIDLPGEGEAGVGPFYIAMEYNNANSLTRTPRKFITTDDKKMRPSSYGPGNTTYVADPAQIAAYIKQLADEKKAKADAEREAEKRAKKAERREIARRFPGLDRLLRRVMFFGQDVRENGARVALLEADTWLSHRDAREGKDITEHTLQLDIKVWGDENVAIMQSILETGIAALIQSEQTVYCKHCGQRILRTAGDRQWWWHVDTTNASCKDADTRAEPAEAGE